MSAKFFPESLYEMGYTDLVSVIPPGAQLTPTSAIPQASVGKVPGKRLPSGLWAGYDWRKSSATLEDVRGWCIAGASVGLRADHFPGVDIDCTDDALAQIIEDVALAKLGGAPVRVGKAPKRLLMYRTMEPFGRMRLVFERDGKTHLVEILGAGQQFLVSGIHPVTQQPYTWNEDLTQRPPKMLKLITREKADAFMTELASALDVLSCAKIQRSGDGTNRERTDAGDQHGLKAPSIESLREAVRLIPNTNALFPNRDDYIKVGYAIRAAGADDKDEAYHIFAEWAMKWEGNGKYKSNDAENVLADWRRMRGPYSVGWSWLAEQARVFGFNTAELEFGVSDAPPDDAIKSAPEYSDQWLAERVVARQRRNLRYAPQQDLFYAWNGAVWQADAELLAQDIVKRELRAIANEVLRIGATKPEIKKSEERAHAICSSQKVPGVASLVKSDRAIAVRMQNLDHDPWLLNTPAGHVDLTTGELRPADPDSLCTKSTGVPPDFGGACPQWLAFLDEACGRDAALVSYLRRLCGYALTGSTREQQLAFIYGPGGNGKSVFLGVLAGVLGDYARVAGMDTFTASHSDKHTTDVAMLTGARLVCASETEAGKRWNETRLKSLTGGEPVTARFMRQDNFTFVPQFKLIFVGNHQPAIRDVDPAMRRRIQMVPFTITPAVIDKELPSKLRAEYPAILAWMIAGCLAWQKDGLAPPLSVLDSTALYFDAEDGVGRWLRERCERVDDETVLTQDLYLSWREWANANGEHVGSLMRLSKALIQRKWERWQEPGTRRLGFKGLKLVELDGLGLLL